MYRSCSMMMFRKFPNVHISKPNFCLVICIAMDLIWTTLKMISYLEYGIFRILNFFLHPTIPDF